MSETIQKLDQITMVCAVTQFKSQYLIQEGRRIANGTNSKLYVVTVQQKCDWGKKFDKELETLLKTSKELKAEMLIFFSDEPLTIFKDFIKRSNVKDIVLGIEVEKALDFSKKIKINSEDMAMHFCKYE